MLQGMRKSILYGIEPACRNVSLVSANFSVNQMSPIIFQYYYYLVKHLYYFGDNRGTKDIKKIKLLVTLISYRISHNFPALER